MKPILRGSKAGFTLVELIVVIAILAILAGVAIPVYSGYIEKANQAADETLLAAVNTAYAAACLENEKDPRTVSASATLSDGKLTGVAPYNDSFARYFAGNGDSKFKYYKSLVYKKADGVFKGTDWELSYDAETGVYSVTNSRGETVTISEDDRDALLNSTFGTTLGIDGLTAEVANITDAASGVLKNVGSVTNWKGFSDLLETLGLKADTATSDQIANAVVLYTAQGFDKADFSSLNLATDSTFLTKGTTTAVTTALRNAGITDATASVALTAAFNYALATAYANSDSAKTDMITIKVNGKDETMSAYDYYQSVSSGLSESENGTTAAKAIMQMNQNLANPRNVAGVGQVVNEGWKNYVEAHANDDFQAFLGAMSTISNNIDNIDGQTYANQGIDGDYMTEILALLYGG